MSEFNSYARQLYNLMEKKIERFSGIEESLQAAKQAKRDNPMPHGWADKKLYESARKADADYHVALIDYEEMKRNLNSVHEEIAAIRNNLESSVDKALAVKSEEVDQSTLELLRSGVMKPNDYDQMLSSAIEDGNKTMARLISKYAADKAHEIATTPGRGFDDSEAVALRYIGARSGKSKEEYLSEFDEIADACTRTMGNSYLAKNEEIRNMIADAVERF